MTTSTAETARVLAAARTGTCRVMLSLEQRPAELAEAYAIQDAIGQALAPGGAVIRGWKVGAPDAKSVPTAAPIYDVRSGPVRIPASHFNMIGVEAEIAYVFGADLAPRAAPYNEDEVLRSVRTMCIAIEVCDSRLADWQTADDLTKLADHQLNYALVTGDSTTDFRGIDFRRQPVRTLIDGKMLKEGIGCHALDDPSHLLPWLVNHAAARGGVRSGTVVTTGSWLGMHFVAPDSEVTVEFAGIGRATVSFPK